MLQFRLMTLADYDNVYQLWLSTPGMGLNTTDDSRAGIARYLKRNPSTCFVALDGPKLVGAILAGHDGRRGYLYHTAVLPQYRQQGIATRLTDRVMAALEKEGIAKVALVVFDRNEPGNAFWESRGFSQRDDLVYRNRSLCAIERIDT